MPEDFSKELLKSAASDAPSASAKARAVGAAERALRVSANAVAGAAGAKAAIGSKLALAVAASAIVAGGAGMGGGYVWGRVSAPVKVVHEESAANPAEAAIVTPVPTTPAAPPASAQPAAPVASRNAADRADVCESVTATESNRCSTNGGHSVTFALKSSCSKDVLDVFWVDTSCREVFKGFIHPGEVYWSNNWDSHRYRLRNHVTHKLVKEFTPQAVSGAPDRETSWKGPPTELPVVTVKESDQPITETPPPECTHSGSRAAMIHIHNDRKDTVVVTSVDRECQEQWNTEIEAGGKVDLHTSEGNAYRIRDAAGALLLDIPPTSLDTTTYLSVP